MKKRYVYDNTEVQLTGRRAIKALQEVIGKRRSTKPHIEPDYKVEITPIDGPTWKNWVSINDLYEIQEENDE